MTITQREQDLLNYVRSQKGIKEVPIPHSAKGTRRKNTGNTIGDLCPNLKQSLTSMVIPPSPKE